MCLDVRQTCQCGKHSIQFHLKDNVMLPEVVSGLYCPDCPGDSAFDPRTMLMDNGWVIVYDMLLARMIAAQKLQMAADEVSPVFLFDSGFATWQEMYPGERDEIKGEREKIITLLKNDQKKYLEAMQRWNIERIEKLREAGWRKVQQA